MTDHSDKRHFIKQNAGRLLAALLADECEAVWWSDKAWSEHRAKAIQQVSLLYDEIAALKDADLEPLPEPVAPEMVLTQPESLPCPSGCRGGWSVSTGARCQTCNGLGRVFKP